MNVDRLRLIGTVSSALLPLARAWRREADTALAEYGLSEATAYPIIYLRRLGDGRQQRVLAEAMGIEGPSLVRLLDQLAELGLIERREDPEDRRAKTLHLTAEGRALARRIDSVFRTLRLRVFKDIPEADLEATIRVFRAVEKALGQSNIVAGPDEEP